MSSTNLSNFLHTYIFTYSATKEIGFGIYNPFELCFFDQMIDGRVYFHAVILDLIGHIYEKNLVILSQKNIVNLCLNFSLGQLLLLFG